MVTSGLGSTTAKQINIRKGLKTANGRRKTFTNKFGSTQDNFTKNNSNYGNGEEDETENDKPDQTPTTKFVGIFYIILFSIHQL